MRNLTESKWLLLVTEDLNLPANVGADRCVHPYGKPSMEYYANKSRFLPGFILLFMGTQGARIGLLLYNCYRTMLFYRCRL